MGDASDIIHLNLYCDERIQERLEDDMLERVPAYWDYTGMLLVPASIEDELVRRLLNARCLSETPHPWGTCQPPCRFHDKNNTEVHYQELDSGHKFRVASAWLDFLLDNNLRDLGLVYFYILGIDRSKLDFDRFGPRTQVDRDLTIYNRFFRTAVLRSTKTFFGRYRTIHIDTIFHDRGSGERHPLFPWHAIARLGSSDQKLEFGDSQIRFLDSDHRAPEGDPVRSHLLQFIDLILGCTVNILHCSSKDKNKLGASRQIKPLVGDRIIKNPRNKNSSYHYVGRQRVEFFPKTNLAAYDVKSLEYQMHQLSNFYTDREQRIERLVQPTLFDHLRQQ